MEAVTAQGCCTVNVDFAGFICLFFLNLCILRMLTKPILNQDYHCFLATRSHTHTVQLVPVKFSSSCTYTGRYFGLLCEHSLWKVQ